MGIDNGMAPARAVRNDARNKLLGQIKQAIQDKEDEFENRLDLYRFVLELVNMRLYHWLNSGPLARFSNVSWEKRHAVFKILTDADATIEQFQRAPEEGLALWAELLAWTTMQIANTHLSALQALEVNNPGLIFGAESAMTEVPIG